MSRVFLTNQQARVLRLLAQGLTTRQIAGRLKLTERMIYFHIRDLKKRLKADSRAQLLLRAVELCPKYLSKEKEE